ncbi:MAG: DUF3300 domain-containing protein [Kangiellaceae bacterium]|nr:DUF3300 domain-containing protein [Kangiellaceae bacterium]
MNKLMVLLSAIFLLFTTNYISAEQAQQQDIEPFSEAELEQILAPIALYPDTILSHILIAATYPLEVIQAERWTNKNTDLESSSAVEAVEGMEWDPSVKALVAFPQVLQRLSENLDWTQKLGDAFLQNEEKLLASVQALRQRAYRSGNLDKMDKVSVTHDQDSIVIEPIEREVVYVPYYDTRVVYGPWHWSRYPPVYWYHSRLSHHSHNPFFWGPSIHVSFGFHFSSFHWYDRHLVRIPWHHYRPHHYYDRHEIMRHQHARRWAHNPSHRRGVSYRSVTVRNRYSSNRASQNEIRQHRDEQRVNTSRRSLSTRDNRNERVSSNSRNEVRTNRNIRVTSSERIRDELRDGRISIKERNARPTNIVTRDRNRATETRPTNLGANNRPAHNTTRNRENRRLETPNVIPQRRVEPVRQAPTKQPEVRRETRDNNSSSSSNRSSSRQSSSNRSSNRTTSKKNSSRNSSSHSSRSGRSKKRDN